MQKNLSTVSKKRKITDRWEQNQPPRSPPALSLRAVLEFTPMHRVGLAALQVTFCRHNMELFVLRH